MEQLSFWSEELPVSLSPLQDSVKDSKTQEGILPSSIVEFLTTLDPSGSFGKTCQASSVPTKDGILVPSSGRWLNSGMGSHIGFLMLKTSESHKDAEESLLSDILETGDLPQRFFLSPTACSGILRRASKRGKALPPLLQVALEDTAKESELSDKREGISEEEVKQS